MSDRRKLSSQLLGKIIRACNKKGGVIAASVGITSSRFKWYHEASTTDRLAAHEDLEQFSLRCPAFALEYKKQGFDAVPVLSKITVSDGARFLAEVGVTPKVEELESKVCEAETLLTIAPTWLKKSLQALPKLWRTGQACQGFLPKHLNKIGLAIKVIHWMDSSEGGACDFRTASVHALGDSKLLEKNLRGIAQVLKLKSPKQLANLSDSEVLETFGLSKLGAELKLRGACRVNYPEGGMNTTFASPYISLPTDDIAAISCIDTPLYILLIENLTTFRRYCDQIKDQSLVVYTGGFPSNAWVRLMATMLKTLPDTTKLFHWGDIDIGGYRILSYLTQSLDVEVIPYRMINVETPESNEQLDITDMRRALGHGLTGELLKLDKQLEELADNGRGFIRSLEQESLEIIAPIQSMGSQHFNSERIE